MNTEYVADYFDETLPYYKHFWHRDPESNALHYGFWEHDTRTIAQALLNENKFLAEAASISSYDKILDAGCGIGGSALWLAKNAGATVIGITISTRQLEKANELRTQYGLAEKTTFQLRDYLHTGFPDEMFDVVWAIESVCYAEHKQDFLKEAHRILKKGGRLIIADGFLKRRVESLERKPYYRFLAGLALPNLAPFSEFIEWIHGAGFHNVRAWDKTTEIKKSSRILFQRCLIAYPFFKIAHLLGYISDIVMRNGPAGIAQYKLVKSGLLCYGVVFARK